MAITFPTLLCSRVPCKKDTNTLGPDYVIRTRLLEILENEIQTITICDFLCFL